MASTETHELQPVQKLEDLKIRHERIKADGVDLHVALIDQIGIVPSECPCENITPPADILAAMEKQMRAEREKRAVILTSEGARDAAVNTAEGEKQQVIKASEANKQQQINEAEGEAAAILAVATATAEGIRRVAEAMRIEGGYEAVQLRVAENYIARFGELAKASNTVILPASISDVASMIALAMNVIPRVKAGS
jgi:regulator of protease activity HflC (stomatin/prohibitin superfamily)